jgi:NitT/TauT family transport system substrate-binding protein
MTRSRTLVIFTLIVAFVAGCRGESPGNPGNPAKPEKRKISVRLAWLPDMAEVGLFVAKDTGEFAKENLDVDIEAGGFGLDPIKLVASKSNDFGIAGAGNLLLARERGIPVRTIAAEFQETPVVFLAKKGREKFVSLRGKRVGIQTGADTEIIYRALLRASGVSSEEVTETGIEYDMRPFIAGDIDVLPAYVTNQPIALAANGIAVDSINPQSLGIDYYGNMFFTSEDMIASDPETVRRFVTALRRGWKRALTDKRTAVAVMSKRLPGVPVATLEKSWDTLAPYIIPGASQPGVPILGMTEQRWRSTYDVLIRNGLSRKQIEVPTVFTNEFLGPEPSK